MKVALNTNVLISALIRKTAAPHHIYQAWRDKRLKVLTCAEQLVEVREVTRRVAVALRIKPAETGRLVISLRDLAVVLTDLPVVQLSPDPKVDFILGMAQAGGARYLVTGNKSGLLALKEHAGSTVLTAAQFVRRGLA